MLIRENRMVDQKVVVIQNESNALGLAGLVFTGLAWLTCGLSLANEDCTGFISNGIESSTRRSKL
jgi:hypothetical protein